MMYKPVVPKSSPLARSSPWKVPILPTSFPRNV